MPDRNRPFLRAIILYIAVLERLAFEFSCAALYANSITVGGKAKRTACTGVVPKIAINVLAVKWRVLIQRYLK